MRTLRTMLSIENEMFQLELDQEEYAKDLRVAKENYDSCEIQICELYPMLEEARCMANTDDIFDAEDHDWKLTPTSDENDGGQNIMMDYVCSKCGVVSHEQ